MKNVGKIILSAMIVALAGFLLCYFMIIIVFWMPGMYDRQRTIGTYIGTAMMLLSGINIIGMEILFHFIAKKKEFPRKLSIVVLLLASVLYALLMLFAYEPALGIIPDLLPDNNELAPGYTVFFIQIFTISGAIICCLVNAIRLFISAEKTPKSTSGE